MPPSAIDVLRRNDPATTSIFIYLGQENSDPALALALEENDFVRDVSLVVDGMAPDARWDALLRVLQGHRNLKRVYLFNPIRLTGNRRP